MQEPTFYSDAELVQLGVNVRGRNVKLDRTARLHNPALITLEGHARIDAFCILSAGPGGIRIGRHVHVGAGSYLFGGSGRIDLEAFSGLSARVTLYTSTDDYTEGWLTNPTVPAEFRKCKTGDITLKKHAIVGAGTILLPNVVVGTGASVGALSLIRKSVPDQVVCYGNPLQRLPTKRDLARLLSLEHEVNVLDDRSPGSTDSPTSEGP